MRDPATGTSRGFAFLTYEDASCMETVLTREHTLDGKAVSTPISLTLSFTNQSTSPDRP